MLKRFIKYKNFIPSKLRRFLRKIYFNRITANFENLIFLNKVNFLKLEINDKDKIISNKTKQLIRHSLYEYYELEAIGLTSYFVSQALFGKKIIVVEPVLDYLNFSKKILNKDQNEIVFLNKAIYYDNEIAYIKRGISNLSSSINASSGDAVEITSLSEIISINNLKEFNLLVDIEGYGFQLLFEEEGALQNCRKIIIDEKIDTNFTYEVVEEQLNKLGFEIVYSQNAWNGIVLGAVKHNLF
jgi:FkbM family methyltransferase